MQKRKQIKKTIPTRGIARSSRQQVVWNLNHALEGKSPEAIIAQIKKDTEIFKKSRVQLRKDISAKELYTIIALKEHILSKTYRVSGFYDLKFYANTTDDAAIAQRSYLNQLQTAISNDLLFFALWFMELDDASAQRLVNAPELCTYRHYLELIRIQKPYTKSEEIERIINLKGMTGASAFADIYEMFTNNYQFMLDGKNMDKEEVVSLFRSPDPRLRETAYTAIFSQYKKDSVGLAEIYKNVVLDWYNEEIKIRGYPSPISVRNMGNDIDDRAVEVLLKAIKKNSAVFADYFALKHAMNKRAGKPYPFTRFHLYAPYPLKLTQTYDYEKSKEMTLEIYRNFDERFFAIAKKIFDAGHVHSHPAPNKRGGAFCFDMPTGTLPYILLNHTDDLRDVFTMMHEFGHGIHMVLSQEQTYLLQHASIPMSETASVFGEMLLAQHLLHTSTDIAEKRHILMSLLDNQYATIMRQAGFVLFEKYAHENISGQLSQDALNAQYLALLKEQFGTMKIPELFKYEWNYIPHIYESPFYCYAYAWGNLLVLALFQRYKKEGKKFVDKYVAFLKTGGSQSGSKMMQALGVDPADEQFWQSGFDLIKEEIQELKKLEKEGKTV